LGLIFAFRAWFGKDPIVIDDIRELLTLALLEALNNAKNEINS
jgi:hypothetical protein